MPADLQQGSRGGDVSLLQRLLRDLNYYRDGDLDGDFGPLTEAAVIQFQEDYGINEGGRVESGTWGALENQYGPLEGMRDPDVVENFVEGTYGTLNSSMDPTLRLQLLADSGNHALWAGQPDAPAVVFDYDTSLPATDAYFDFATWKAFVSDRIFDGYTDDAGNPRAPSSDELSELLSTIYHELHHAEQWFEMARFVYGTQGADAAAIGTQMGIPLFVAEAAIAAGGITECGVGGGPALEWYESVYGTGSANRDAVLGSLSDSDPTNDRHEEYREHLPEEEDGWNAGGAVRREYREFEEGDDPRRRPTLRRGDEGAEVGYLQQLLVWRQVDPAPGDRDNDFGPNTESSVKAFQRSVGIDDDGVVGTDTWVALMPN
jgi:peptidoglycan hydrolase-like protein with peptidoglycan-binding domain